MARLHTRYLSHKDLVPLPVREFFPEPAIVETPERPFEAGRETPLGDESPTQASSAVPRGKVIRILSLVVCVFGAVIAVSLLLATTALTGVFWSSVAIVVGGTTGVLAFLLSERTTHN